ncbi:hypothetical protein L596_015387 [Steinernema carpocapsae]|uniref:Ionotropic glutamate receptor C-terminal domain-containing protein n=1 Tax=Steinernema carpocapsae TaxID=34508 RepID=A0A4U5NG43_STECR|nr:hypothetical protein L596_015387 [Steinernema carpocapsae]
MTHIKYGRKRSLASICIETAETLRISAVFDDVTSKGAQRVLQHLNASLLYHKGLKNISESEISVIQLTQGEKIDEIQRKFREAIFLLSFVQNPDLRTLVKDVSLALRLPTIQTVWSMPNISKFAKTRNSYLLFSGNEVDNVTIDHDNFISLVPASAVFDNIIPEVIPKLNITREATVLYDEHSGGSMSHFQRMFEEMPVKIKFEKIVANDDDISAHLRKLQETTSTVIFVAVTKNVERYVLKAGGQINRGLFRWVTITEDVRAFKCEDCFAVEMFWVRPYPSGKIEEIRAINEFMKQDGLDLIHNYTINTWEEIDVCYLQDLIQLAITYFRELNNTLVKTSRNGISSYFYIGYNHPPANLTLSDLIRRLEPTEYGGYKHFEEHYFYQDVKGYIFRIDRHADEPDKNINKLIGNWTKETGIVPLYSTLGVKVRQINHYRVAVLTMPPFIERYPDKINGPYFEGYCIDLLKLIQEKLKFTYDIFEVEDGKFGNMDDNGNWNGLIGTLVSGTADIALAPLSVMAERENDVDFTVPYYDLVGTTILMKKQDVEYSLFKFMKVLELPVWLCIVGAYLFTSLLLYIFERFSPYSLSNNRLKYHADPEQREFTLKECLWFCMTSLTPQGGGEAPKNISGRLVAATWWLFGFIIIASYTANLAAFLTVSRLDKPIDSLDDLAKQYKIEYAPMAGTASETYFRRMADIEEKFYNIWKRMALNESMSLKDRSQLAIWDYPVTDKFTNMWRYMKESQLPKTFEEAVDRVLNSKDGFAYIGDATEIKYAALTNCKLQQVGTEFSRKPYAIAVQTGSALKDDISKTILQLLNKRKLEILKEKWWAENPNKMVCPSLEDDSNGISIQNIGGVFIVILAGIVLALITLIFEYFCTRKRIKKTTRHLSRKLTSVGLPGLSRENSVQEKPEEPVHTPNPITVTDESAFTLEPMGNGIFHRRGSTATERVGEATRNGASNAAFEF